MAARSLLPPKPLRRGVLIAAAVVLVLRLTYFLFLDLADGRSGHELERVFNEITGGVLALIPLGAAAWLARRVPLAPPIARRTIAIWAASFVVLSTVHTAAMVVVRALLGPALGLGGYGYDFRLARFAYEAANDVFVFLAAVACVAFAESVLAWRARERSAAALEQALLRAELSNLRLQLQPHFLFNALNTISSTMYDDVEAADALLGRLADLLRTSLRTTHTQEVAARDELAVLAQYLDLMHARFGDALDVSIDAPDDVQSLLVPSMVLQPLVENAVRHGGVSRVGHGSVRVTLRRGLDGLTIQVRDAVEFTTEGTEDTEELQRPSSVSSVSSVVKPEGTGLSATARRLHLLYSDDHTLHAGPRNDGWQVSIRIPAREAFA